MKKIIFLSFFINLVIINLSFAENEKTFLNQGESLKKEGRWNEAINEFNKVLKLNPKSDESYYQIGIICEYQLKYQEAIYSFQKASKIDSKYAFYAGLDYENLEKWDDAISSFKKALSDYPDFINAGFHLGLSYERKKMYNEAISEFKKILEKNQNHAGSIYNIAIIYKELGLISEAKKETLRFNQITFSEWKP